MLHATLAILEIAIQWVMLAFLAKDLVPNLIVHLLEGMLPSPSYSLVGKPSFPSSPSVLSLMPS